MTVHANWRVDASCRHADPDLFFPVSTAGPALRQTAEAKRICQVCPARTPCRAWALDHRISSGIWVGPQRKSAKKSSAPAAQARRQLLMNNPSDYRPNAVSR
jgi:WhiB family transcriptional regulator, redox-sensing transcriptional regulator